MRLNRSGLGAGVSRGLLASVSLVVAGALALSIGSRPSQSPVAAGTKSPVFSFSAPTPQPVQAVYGNLPLMFEANQGQTDSQVKFLARGSKYGLFLTANEAVLALQSSAAVRQSSATQTSVLRMSLVGGNPNADVAGSQVLPGKSNYLIGDNPAKWHRNVPQFARVRYRDAYPGIDLVYYGKQGKLEYDFEVAPGVDPKQVALQFQGVEKLELDADHALNVSVGDSQVRFDAPRVYQIIAGVEQTVAGHFVLQGNNQVSFEIGAYDRSQTLVIDPVLTYSTYLGGSGLESFPTIAVDSAFNAYVAGTTTSADFPVTADVFQKCLGDPSNPTTCPSATASDVFIAKFDSNGAALAYATYLGGSGDDVSTDIVVDSGFNPIVVGSTNSANFPTKNAFQGTAASAGTHAFVSKLDAAGANLLYSTYLSGGGTDIATGVAINAQNKIFLTGTTTSINFPVTPNAFQGTSKASSQFFVSEVDPTTSAVASLPYSTYFGGGNPAGGTTIGGGIVVDGVGNVLITGGTNFLNTGSNASTDFPILNASQACLDAPSNPTTCPTGVTATDAFVAKLNPSAAVGSQLLYSTFVGGTGNDSGNGVAVDNANNAYVTGSTTSPDIVIPTGTTPFQKCLDDATNPTTCSASVTASDAFLAKLSSFTTGTTTTPTVTMLYFSYLGGSGTDVGLAIAVDKASGARITGSTNSADFHTTASPIQGALSGPSDAFVARIDTTATSATAAGHYATYLGGSSTDRGTGIAIDSGSAIYVAGETASSNFPLAGPFQATRNGASDAFVTKLGGVVNLSMTATVTSPAPPNPIGVGNAVTFSYKITNNGDLLSGITFNSTVPNGSTLTSATGPSGTCAAVNSTLTCPVGTLNPAGIATFTLILVPTAGAVPSPGPTTLGSSATLSVFGSPFTTSATATVTVNDFSLDVSPSSRTVQAGKGTTYTAVVTPTGSFPNTVTLSCTGLPTGASCSTANGSITDLKNGSAQSRNLVVNTTERVTTTAGFWQNGKILYATWLPISGLAFLGLGIGGSRSRKRRVLLGLLLGAFLMLTVILSGCGSSSKGTSTTTGTPAGTYTFTVSAKSGTASHTKTLQLVVE